MAEENKKVEHVNGGDVRTFSAIHGKGQSGKAPEAKVYGEKKAIVGINQNKK